MVSESEKKVEWMGDSKKRLRNFPDEVKHEIGQALYEAQCGEHHISAHPMKGINAVEIVTDFGGDAFRGIYTTKFEDAIYVLHCFQKKSKKGSKTPKPDIALIGRRLSDAKKHYEASKKQHETENKN